MRKLLRPPGPGACVEYKKRFIDQENLRLVTLNSPWRFGFSSADPSCVCLLAEKTYKKKED